MTEQVRTTQAAAVVSPLRPPTGHDRQAVRASFLRLAERFLPDQAAGVAATYVIDLAGLPPTTVQVADGRCLVSPGDRGDADARLLTDPATWLAMVDGEVDGLRAFTAGRLQVRGDLQRAVDLETMFRPGPAAWRVLRTRTTTVRGVPISSWVAGTGAPVVLLHGLAASKVTFVPTLDDLSDDHEVHALDLPGFGGSGKPLPGGKRYTPGWFADRVVGYLDAHGLDAVHLVGNSMGGRVAAEVALRYPRRVRSLTGLGAAVAFDGWQRVRPITSLVRWQWAGAAPVRVPVWLVERGIRELFHDPDRVPAANLRAAAEEADRYLRDPGYRLAVAAAARGLVTERTWGRKGFWRRLEGLQVPSLWLWGRSDVMVPSRYGARVAQLLPDAQVEVWDDLGHVPQFELPTRTHALVRTFLDRTGH